LLLLWAGRARVGRVSRHGRVFPGRSGCCGTPGGPVRGPAAGRDRAVSPRGGGDLRPGAVRAGAGRARP
jgi:hypothetical protein